MDQGELLTRWTVRIAIAFYVISLVSRGSWPKGSRLAWTGGCAFYLLHVVCAFEYYHHWSQAAAYAATAKQTAEVVGIDWGGGLYVNYAFTLVWLADVGWWWVDAERYCNRPRWIEWLVQGFLGFIVFNATVVFASGFSRWLGIAACGLLALVFVRRSI
jgi:hypothetical protein